MSNGSAAISGTESWTADHHANLAASNVSRALCEAAIHGNERDVVEMAIIHRQDRPIKH
jgi:hypothetical protein